MKKYCIIVLLLLVALGAVAQLPEINEGYGDWVYSQLDDPMTDDSYTMFMCPNVFTYNEEEMMVVRYVKQYNSWDWGLITIGTEHPKAEVINVRYGKEEEKSIKFNTNGAILLYTPIKDMEKFLQYTVISIRYRGQVYKFQMEGLRKTIQSLNIVINNTL